MSGKKYEWHKIAESVDELRFGENGMAVAELEGRPVCIGRFDGELYAFARKCPHAGGYMDQGFIDVLGNVVCPLHRYKFSVQNGRNTSGEGYYLKRWPLEIREDGVFAGTEKWGFPGF